MKRRLLVWLFFRVTRALNARVIEKNLKELGLSNNDAKFVIKYYRAAVR
ncbi:MAG: hypothetical protein ACXWF8_10590 [Methylobacter sp.]